jgi:hypothetical protein
VVRAFPRVSTLNGLLREVHAEVSVAKLKLFVDGELKREHVASVWRAAPVSVIVPTLQYVL